MNNPGMMKRTWLYDCLFAITFCLLWTLTIPTSVAATHSIFNGKDLTGWTEVNEEGAFSASKGELVLSQPHHYPGWLRTDKKYENFRLSLEYLTPGWCESGIFIHAPLYGRQSRSGIKIHLRHNNENEGSRSVGALYDILPPMALVADGRNQWNRLEIDCDWPHLKVTLNGTVIQDVNMELVPELRWRMRSGYIGIQDLGCQIRFRNISIEELPSRETWKELFNGRDLTGWHIRDNAPWKVEDGKIISEGGDGYLITDDTFSSFVFQVFVKTSKLANGGIFFRWGVDGGRGYETQVFNVPDATNPTGSIYGVVPSKDPSSRDGEWFSLQIISDGAYAAVFVNGDKVAESSSLPLRDQGQIAFQMHRDGSRLEFLEPRIKPIPH